MISTKLWLLALADVTGPVWPMVNHDTFQALEQLTYIHLCRDCYAQGADKVLKCKLAEDLRLALLNDPVLQQPLHYIHFGLPSRGELGNFPSYVERELDYAGIMILRSLDSTYPENIGPRRHRTLIEVAQHLSNACNLAATPQGAAGTPQFGLLRQLLRQVEGSRNTEYGAHFRLPYKPFGERMKIKPITELVNELAAVDIGECPLRTS